MGIVDPDTGVDPETLDEAIRAAAQVFGLRQDGKAGLKRRQQWPGGAEPKAEPDTEETTRVEAGLRALLQELPDDLTVRQLREAIQERIVE